MQASLLHIGKIELSSLTIQVISGGTGEQELIEPFVDVLRHNEKPHNWLVRLTLRFEGNARAKYEGSIGLYGEFSTKESLKPEVAEDLINVNGPAILYSTAREVVLTVTSRSANGPWMLPSVTFIDRKKRQPDPAKPDSAGGAKNE